MKKRLLLLLCLPLISLSQQTYVPDNNFENYLENNGMGNGIANDNYVTTANINTVTWLEVQWENISDLTGIEGFASLVFLNCRGNQLTTLDLSNNTALSSFYCENNQLTTLDLSTNTALGFIRCYGNQLTTLDLSNNTALGNLECYGNQLTTLDLSASTALHTLKCYGNQLTTLDLSTNTALHTLHCFNNQLTTLDLSNNTALQALDCGNNQLTTLDLSTNTALTYLQCQYNQLGSLDVSNNPALTSLKCNDNQLSTLDTRNGNNSGYGYYINVMFGSNIWVWGIRVFNNPNLTCINVDDPVFATTYWATGNYTGNQDPQHYFSANCNSNCAQTTSIPDANFEAYLETHDASGNTATWPNTMGDGIANNGLVCTANINTVISLDVNNQSISDLTGIEDFTALISLDCNSNQLTTLDVSTNAVLTYLNCGNNQLTSLDVSTNTALTHLYCGANQLTSLDVGNNTILIHLYCSNNLLTSIDVSTNTALNKLQLNNNYLTILDVSTNTALTHLYCSFNQLTSLDVSGATVLEFLYCDNNQLTTLDVSTNAVLIYLKCHENQLISLDVSTNTALLVLQCNNSQLTNLDVSNNTSLIYLNCHSSQLTILDVRNGNNTNIPNFICTNNPNLTCISVDDPVYSTANWTNIDPQHTFSTNCSNCTQTTSIPDANFEAYLETHDASGNTATWPNTMGDGVANNGEVCTANINMVTNLNVNSQNISDLTGIEDFVALTYLNCGINQLTNLDISQNIALTYLNCYNNQILSLDISNNILLTSLSCNTNQLTSLDVSFNTALLDLRCYANPISTLDVSFNTSLTMLQCYSNQLTTLNLSNNINLQTLFSHSNQLTDLDLSNNTSLSYLYCSNNNLLTLDVKNGNNTNMTNFNCTNNQNLTCITVDDDVYSTANWTNIDPQHYFSTNCTPTCGAITGVNLTDLIDDRVVFNWDNMNQGSCVVDQIRIRYRVVGTSVYSTKTMGAPVGNNAPCLNTSKLALNLLPSTQYEYDFKLWYQNGTTVNWHVNGTFTTAAACVNVTNVTATPNSATQTEFCWTPPSTPYEFVRLKYRENVQGSLFSNIGGFGVWNPFLYSSGSYCKTKNGLTPGTQYRVMWRTWCSATGGPYRSPVWDGPVLWTQNSPIRVEGGTTINNLDVYPNPSRDIFNITFTSEDVQNLVLRIINVIGEVIYTENLEQFVGEYTKQVDLATYTKGVYLLELDTDNGIVSKKLILQ